MVQQLPPVPSGNTPLQPNTRRKFDNCPAWMTLNNESEKMGFEEKDTNTEDTRRKRGRIWVFPANILIRDAATVTPPMPLDVDNGLPGIELWFGTHMNHEDTCAVMNTGDLLFHKWLMTKHPHLVADYIQFDNSCPFQPLQLHCAVADLERVESMHGKLTAIVRYWSCYEQDGKGVLLSFGLGNSVTFNLIAGIPINPRTMHAMISCAQCAH